MKKYILIFMIASVAGLSGYAQTEETRYSLAECRALAVENNAKVKTARNATLEAREVSKEAFTKYFPTISGQGFAMTANHDVLQYDVMDLFTIGLVKKGWSAGITATQPVFAGGRIVNGNKLAHVGEQAAQLQEEAAMDNTALTAEQYYWQISTLKAKRATLEAVMQMVDTLQSQVKAAVDAGVLLRNELLKVELRRGELESLQVDLDNGITLACNLLAQYIGKDGEKIDIIEEPLDTLAMYPSDIYVSPETALGGTTSYRLLDKQVEAADLEHKIAVGSRLPTLGVGAGYFYDDLVNQKHSFGALFVSLSVPISEWWGGSHAIKKSKIAAETARIEKEDLSQMLELNMKNSWDELTAAYRKMDIARRSIGQARENLRLNRDYYLAGVSTITDLLDAQMLYQQSMDQYSEAYGHYRLMRAKYANATGRELYSE